MRKTLLLLTLILAIKMNAQTEFTATEDVYVKGGSTDTNNYNSADGAESPILEIKIGGNADFFRKTLIKFDLSESGLSGSDVENATLRLRVADVQKKTADPATITVSGTTDTWSEATVSYSDAPASGEALSAVEGITGTDRPTEDGGSDGADKYWDVTSFVKTELDGDQIISLVLEDLGAANNTITFSSKAGANAPVLIINDTALNNSKINDDPNTISLHPNPTKDFFIIDTPNSAISNIKVFSVKGSVLFEDHQINSKHLKVDTSAFQPGIYLVHTKNAEGILSVKKLIKK